jgi:hypothetical protein
VKFRWSILGVKRRSFVVSVVRRPLLEIVADDRNNQPRRCGIWVSRVSTFNTLTETLAVFSTYWSRVTYLVQRQHGVILKVPLALTPRIPLLTRSVRTMADLGLLTFRPGPGKSVDHRIIPSLRLHRHRWPQLSLSAFLEMRTES